MSCMQSKSQPEFLVPESPHSRGSRERVALEEMFVMKIMLCQRVMEKYRWEETTEVPSKEAMQVPGQAAGRPLGCPDWQQEGHWST